MQRILVDSTLFINQHTPSFLPIESRYHDSMFNLFNRNNLIDLEKIVCWARVSSSQVFQLSQVIIKNSQLFEIMYNLRAPSRHFWQLFWCYNAWIPMFVWFAWSNHGEIFQASVLSYVVISNKELFQAN